MLENTRYYSQIDALKGIAAFFVVLGHSIIWYPIDLHQNEICDFVFRFVISVHMPLFFCVSGYCFSYKDDYKSYIVKKIKRILIPYIIFNFIDIFPRAFFPQLVNRSRGIGESIQRVLLNGGEYWFLYTLFIIFLIYPLIYKLINKGKLYSVGVLGVIFLTSYTMPSIELFKISDLLYFIFYFTLGVLLKKYLGDTLFKSEIGKAKSFWTILLLVVLWLLLIKVDNEDIAVLTALIGIVSIYFCTQSKKFVDLFSNFGKYSLQLYLLNGYLLVISRTIMVLILEITNPIVVISFNMLVDFFLSYIIIKYICEKIKPIKIVMGMQ